MHEDVKEGEWKTIVLSGKIPPSVKSEMLARIDKLSGIYQNARESANIQEAESVDHAQKIIDYIMKPLKDALK